MDKRIFAIDKDCFIVFTGQSSADTKSFLRIGTSKLVDEKIQDSVGYIVVPDATKINYEMEVQNIHNMERGKIRYICNKENRSLLFKELELKGVNTESLYHKDLSPELENISKVENKKHFFTIFYKNKNVKIVSNEDIFFDLFDFKKSTLNKKIDLKRLIVLIDQLENLRETHLTNKDTVFDLDKTSVFLFQSSLYIPLIDAMYSTTLNDNKLEITFNSSSRFYVGKELNITIIEDGKETNSAKGIITEGDVISDEILYQYKAIFENVEWL